MADKTKKLDDAAGPPREPAQAAQGKGGTARIGNSPNPQPVLPAAPAAAGPAEAAPRVPLPATTVKMREALLGGTAKAEPDLSALDRSSVPPVVVDRSSAPPAAAAERSSVPITLVDDPSLSPTPSSPMILVQGGAAVGRPDPENTRYVVPQMTLVVGAIANRRDITSFGAIADGQRVGRFVLDSRLGEGSYGQVFRAHDERLPQFQVAVKVIPMKKQSIEDTNKELAALATVSHPNIVSLLDHGTGQLATGEGQPLSVAWFAMPLYRGKNLTEHIATAPLPPELARRWFRALASAVGALHHAGLRHQDIKPENIFIANFSGGVRASSGDEYEIPILLDLGVATRIHDNDFLAGTPDYFAPEQAHEYQRRSGRRADAAKPLGDRMDVYALALTLFHALGARDPFDRAFEEELSRRGEPLTEAQRSDAYAQALEADPLLLRSSSKHKKQLLPSFRWGPRRRLSDKMKRWFAVDPARRASIDEFYDDLQALLAMQELRARARRAGAQAALLTVLLGATGIAGVEAFSWMNATFRDQLGSKDKELSKLEAQIHGCLQGSAEARKTYEKLVEEKNLCQDTLRGVKDDLEQGKKSMGTEQKKLLTCTFNREADRTACDNDKRELRAQVDRWTQSTHEERTRAEGLAAQLRTSQAAQAKCEADLTACNGDRQRQAGENRALYAKVGELQGQVQAGDEKVSACNASRAQAQGQLQQCQAQLSQCTQQVGGQQQAAQCQAQLGSCSAQVEQLRTSLERCQQRRRP